MILEEFYLEKARDLAKKEGVVFESQAKPKEASTPPDLSQIPLWQGRKKGGMPLDFIKSHYGQWLSPLRLRLQGRAGHRRPQGGHGQALLVVPTANCRRQRSAAGPGSRGRSKGSSRPHRRSLLRHQNHRHDLSRCKSPTGASQSLDRENTTPPLFLSPTAFQPIRLHGCARFHPDAVTRASGYPRKRALIVLRIHHHEKRLVIHHPDCSIINFS
jgi:hypothetical protein